MSFALAVCALLVAVLLALPASLLARRIAAVFALVGLVGLIMTGIKPDSSLMFDYGVAALIIGSITLLVLGVVSLAHLRRAG